MFLSQTLNLLVESLKTLFLLTLFVWSAWAVGRLGMVKCYIINSEIGLFGGGGRKKGNNFRKLDSLVHVVIIK